ncbi:MAG TPA: 50S ribosomal protein L15 [Candidatus Paceibacterota bacterium]|nr:50S ribosomal protein L15 [Candidatus Paceibacterota bacterium]
MQLNELKRKTPNKRVQRVGRGGKRGKTSGRGTKGQDARSGHKKRPEIREILKKLPKLRGYAFNSIQAPALVVNLGALEASFKAGEIVNAKTLSERGLIRMRKNAQSKPVVKILGTGELSKKLVIAGCKVSGTAKAAIEKAGGSIEA